PVAGSMPAVPEQKTNPLAMIAWLYGPRAAGAEPVDTACLITGYHPTDSASRVTLLDRRVSQAPARSWLPVASRLGQVHRMASYGRPWRLSLHAPQPHRSMASRADDI